MQSEDATCEEGGHDDKEIVKRDETLIACASLLKKMLKRGFFAGVTEVMF